MSLRMRPSPPIRHKNSERQTVPRHGFMVRDKPESEAPPPTGAATRILKGVIVIIALLAGSLALWSATRGPDPHYIKARKMVTDYEFGKPLQLTNYEHPIYGEALGELALVDRDSISAEPAEALRVEIERNIEEFRLQQMRLSVRLEETRSKKQKREAREFQVRAYTKLIPFDHEDHPECK